MGLTKARVREGNLYGQHAAGAVVEVDQDELARVPWCLEAVSPAPAEATPAPEDPTASTETVAPLAAEATPLPSEDPPADPVTDENTVAEDPTASTESEIKPSKQKKRSRFGF